MQRLLLSLLGPFQVSLDERPLAGFRSDKTRALLAYLAAERDRPHARHLLAGLLWPDALDATALTYLRGALSNLRRLLGDDAAGQRAGATPFLLVTTATIRLNPAAPSGVDTATFDALVDSVPVQGALEQAAALYRGAFLDGFSLGDSSAFEEWLLLKRAHYERRQLEVLRKLAAQALDGRHYTLAVSYAQRQLALEPWDETAHRQLMMAQALAGRRGAALAQYTACRNLLAHELGAEPSPETTELYLHIRAGHLSASVAPSGAASSAPPYMLQELAPFVARTDELARLDAQLDAVLAGTGRIVFVRGDAGSGKTALLYAFARRATQRRVPVTVADGRCSNYQGSGDVLLPFREIIQLLASAGLLPPDRKDALPLSLRPTPHRERGGAPLNHGDLYAQVTTLLHEAAARRPLILLLDDLQWADSGTLDLLFHLGRRLSGARILIVAAYRPEDVAQSASARRHPLNAVVHELARDTGEAAIDLNQGEGRAFIDALLDVEPNRLDAGFRATLHRHTEGHALFTVELLRAMKDRGALVQSVGGEWMQGVAPDWAHLPPRVEAVIAERIARLPPLLRQVLDAASVQGETFSAEVLAHSLPIDGGQLMWMLGELLSRQHELVQADLRSPLAPSGAAAGTQLLRYRFTHSLYQTYLYKGLDPVQRAYLHRQTGEALEEMAGQGASAPGSEPGIAPASLLAWHYEQGGCIAQAVRCRRAAGDQAMHLSACDEAIGHYLHGLALLETLPPSTARFEQELAMQVALAAPFVLMAGWGGVQAQTAILRACELSAEIGGQSRLVEALFLLATNYVGSGELARASAVNESLLLLAQQSGAPDALVAAHVALGETHLFGCDLAAARLHLETAIHLLETCSLQHLSIAVGIDLRVASLTWLSSTLWASGCLDQALASSQAALAYAQKTGQPRTLGFALLLAGALFDLQRNDLAAAGEKVAAVLQLAGEKNLALYNYIGAVYQGYLRVQAGETTAGIAQMQGGLAAWQGLGASAGVVQHFLLLGRACCAAGEFDRGLATVDEALAFAASHAMPYNEAELWRTRGDLLLLRNGPGAEMEAETCIARARQVAQRQGARLWELRATLSLCRLRQRQGRQAEVLPALAALYAGFREGFTLPDLHAARELLEEAGETA